MKVNLQAALNPEELKEAVRLYAESKTGFKSESVEFDLHVVGHDWDSVSLDGAVVTFECAKKEGNQ